MNDDKKVQAAITAVIYYLRKKQEEKKESPNLWSRSGREMIMRNQEMVQLKDRFR